MNKPHPSYLVTLVAGRFDVVEDRAAQRPDGSSVPIAYYVPPGRQEDAQRSFGETPRMVELFGELIAHALFSLDTIRFLERRHVEPPFGLLALGDYLSAVGYQPVDKRDGCPHLPALDYVRLRRVIRHEYECLKPTPRSVGRERPRRVAGRRDGQAGRAHLFGHREGDRHAARLE